MAKRLVSLAGKVINRSADELSPDRYQYLSLDQAEPNPGNPSQDHGIFVSQADGSRQWVTDNLKLRNISFENDELENFQTAHSATANYALMLKVDPTSTTAADSVGYRELASTAFAESPATLQNVTEEGNITDRGIRISGSADGNTSSGLVISNNAGADIQGPVRFRGNLNSGLITIDNTVEGVVFQDAPADIINSTDILVLGQNDSVRVRNGASGFAFVAPSFEQVVDRSVDNALDGSTPQKGAVSNNYGINIPLLSFSTLPLLASTDERTALVVTGIDDSVRSRELQDLAVQTSTTSAIEVENDLGANKLYVRNPTVGSLPGSGTIPLVFYADDSEYAIVDINVENLDANFETLQSVTARAAVGLDNGETNNEVIFSGEVRLRDGVLTTPTTSKYALMAESTVGTDSAVVRRRLLEDIAFNDNLIDLTFVLSRGDSTEESITLGGKIRVPRNTIQSNFTGNEYPVLAVNTGSADSVGVIQLNTVAYNGEADTLQTVTQRGATGGIDSTDQAIRVNGLYVQRTNRSDGIKFVVDSAAFGETTTGNQFLIYDPTISEFNLRSVDNNILDGQTLQEVTDNGRISDKTIIVQGVLADSAKVSGNFDVAGITTLDSTTVDTHLAVTTLSGGRVVFVGPNSELVDDADLTFNSASNTLTATNVTVSNTLDVDGTTNLDGLNNDGAVNLINLTGTTSETVLIIDGSNNVGSRSIDPNAFTGETLTSVTDPTKPTGYDSTQTALYLNGGISLAVGEQSINPVPANYKLLVVENSGDSVEYLNVASNILDGSALDLDTVLANGNTSTRNILLSGGTSKIEADSATFTDLTVTDSAYLQDLVVFGNLRVDGSTTVINSTELTVNDKNIVLADGALQPSDANGGGITLYLGPSDPAATILYNSVDSVWTFNKDLRTNKTMTVDLDLTVGGNIEGNSLNVINRSTFDSVYANDGMRLGGLENQGTELTLLTIDPNTEVGTREAETTAFTPLSYFTINQAAQTGNNNLDTTLNISSSLIFNNGMRIDDGALNTLTPSAPFDVLMLSASDSVSLVTLQSGAVTPLESITWEQVLSSGDSTGGQNPYIKDGLRIDRDTLQSFTNSRTVMVFDEVDGTRDSVGVRQLGEMANRNDNEVTLDFVVSQNDTTSRKVNINNKLTIDSLVIDNLTQNEDVTNLALHWNNTSGKDSVGYRALGSLAYLDSDSETFKSITEKFNRDNVTTATDISIPKLRLTNISPKPDVSEALFLGLANDSVVSRSLSVTAFEDPDLQFVTETGANRHFSTANTFRDSTNIKVSLGGGLILPETNTPSITTPNTSNKTPGAAFYQMLIINDDSDYVARGDIGNIVQQVSLETFKSVSDRGQQANVSAGKFASDSADVNITFGGNIYYAGINTTELASDDLLVVDRSSGGPGTYRIGLRSLSTIQGSQNLHTITENGNVTDNNIGVNALYLYDGSGFVNGGDTLTDNHILTIDQSRIAYLKEVRADSATIANNFDVQGLTTLDSTTVDGTLTVTDSATITGNLNVSGQTELGSGFPIRLNDRQISVTGNSLTLQAGSHFGDNRPRISLGNNADTQFGTNAGSENIQIYSGGGEIQFIGGSKPGQAGAVTVVNMDSASFNVNVPTTLDSTTIDGTLLIRADNPNKTPRVLLVDSAGASTLEAANSGAQLSASGSLSLKGDDPDINMDIDSDSIIADLIEMRYRIIGENNVIRNGARTTYSKSTKDFVVYGQELGSRLLLGANGTTANILVDSVQAVVGQVDKFKLNTGVQLQDASNRNLVIYDSAGAVLWGNV